MMIVFLSAGILLLVITAMSIGVIMGREPLKGSCGGMSALGMDTACDICGGDAKQCEKNTEAGPKADSELAYEAATPAGADKKA